MLKIALLQIMPEKTLDANLQKGLFACKEAKRKGADIALFPEMWSCGYDFLEDLSVAISADHSFIERFGQLAKELQMAIGITFLEKAGNSARNSFCLFDRFGNKKFIYAKVHTCDFGDEHCLLAGDRFYVADLNTEKGMVKVGGMICYDREFPESARILMLQGAELILTPNACPMEINRLSQLRGRAYENMVAIATCNYPLGKPDCNGHSSLFDGVAYLPDLSGSRDTCLLEVGEEEGIYIAELDLEQLRQYRAREVHGNAYRHPEKYALLTAKEIKEPFIRSDRKE